MTSSADRHGGVPVSHDAQLPRLRRIEGQVRGLQQMIESGRDCLEVAYQIDAVAAALRRVQSDMLRDHLEAIVEATTRGEVPEETRRDLAREVAGLFAKRG